MVKDRLTEKAGYSLPTLMESPAVKPEVFDAPKQVESKASVLNRVVMSGGVAINSWANADKAKPSDAVAPVRAKAAPANRRLVVELMFSGQRRWAVIASHSAGFRMIAATGVF